MEDETSPSETPRFTRIAIRNWKSIRECDLTLGPLTFVVGRNGAGKSNFVDALRFLAVREYECWLLAAAQSIAGECLLSSSLEPPADPESIRDAKGWLSRQMPPAIAYKETQDQEPLTRAFDIEAAAKACPSFARFRRKVHDLLRALAR